MWPRDNGTGASSSGSSGRCTHPGHTGTDEHAGCPRGGSGYTTTSSPTSLRYFATPPAHDLGCGPGKPQAPGPQEGADTYRPWEPSVPAGPGAPPSFRGNTALALSVPSGTVTAACNLPTGGILRRIDRLHRCVGFGVLLSRAPRRTTTPGVTATVDTVESGTSGGRSDPQPPRTTRRRPRAARRQDHPSAVLTHPPPNR